MNMSMGPLPSALGPTVAVGFVAAEGAVGFVAAEA